LFADILSVSEGVSVSRSIREERFLVCIVISLPGELSNFSRNQRKIQRKIQRRIQGKIQRRNRSREVSRGEK